MHPCNPKIKNRFGFTLTELLAVIVIVAILMVAAVPAFLAMGGGSRTGAAATQLAATLRQARQYAIANNQSVSVVFPHAKSRVNGANTTSAASLYSTFDSKRRMLRGYAVYAPRDGYVSEWKFLPEGVIFNCETNNTTNVLYDDDAIANIAYPDDTSAALKMQTVTFRPDGTTQFGAVAYKIFIAAGVTNADADPAAGSMTYTLTAATPTYLEIAPLTGIVKIVSND